ncbi:MAG: hypothetical protein ACI8X5_003088 [Planctomycetota bacterium]|jgi:hypothetical protein
MAFFSLATLCLLMAPSVQHPVGSIEVELEGSSSSTMLSAGFESTELSLDLAARQTRRVPAPFVSRAGLGELWNAPSIAGAQRAKGVALLPGTVEPPPDWERLPPSLQRRGLPRPPRIPPTAGTTNLYWMVAALLLVLSLRRRAWIALALGTATGLALLQAPAPVTSRSLIRVLEGDGESGRWLQVRGSRERLDLAEPSTGWLHCLPREVEFHLELTQRGQEIGWAICASGSRIYFMNEVLAPHRPTRVSADGLTFDEVWLREASGAWSARGPWKGDQALPELVLESDSSLSSSPPAWLASGLPQGVSVLAGHLMGTAEEDSWVRLVGFE